MVMQPKIVFAIWPILAIVIGIIVALIILPKKGKIITAVSVLFLGAVIVVLMSVRLSMRHKVAQPVELYNQAEVEVVSASMTSPTIWDEAIDRKFPADNYPTIQAAAVGLINELSNHLQETIQGLDSLSKIYIMPVLPQGAIGNMALELSYDPIDSSRQNVIVVQKILESMTDEIIRNCPDAKVEMLTYEQGSSAPDIGPDEIQIAVCVNRLDLPIPVSPQELVDFGIISIKQSPPENQEVQEGQIAEPDTPDAFEALNQSGRIGMISRKISQIESENVYIPIKGELKVAVYDNNGFAVRSAPFYHKPWVNLLGELANDKKDYTWFVARSNDAVPDNPVLAHEQAVNNAINWLKPMIMQSLEVDYDIHNPQVDLNESQLKELGLLADAYKQQLKGTAGQICREAILLKVNPQIIHNASKFFLDKHSAHNSMWIKNLLQLAGLLVLIFLLYIFLNYATKGYYSLVLKLLAGVVLAAAVIFFLCLA